MINIRRMPAALWVLRILLLALVYVIAGRLSLLLAIPPGFVTGLFLPLGIALGAVLIWGYSMGVGVFLGSLLLNISVSNASELSAPVVLLAAEIASGSVLASLAGGALIRHFVGFPDSLTDERKIFAFFALGGPVATGLSASVGVLALWVNDVIQAKQILYSWWTWWAGDTIGVLIATPLMCVLFAEPQHFWRGRRLTVGVPLVVSSLIVVAVFVMSSNNEQKKLADQFQQQARLVDDAVQSSMSDVVYTLATLRGLFSASEEVTREEFSAFINDVLVDKQGVSGFSWNRRIMHSERVAFENEMHAEGITSFYINEKNTNGAFSVASEQEEYVVITYVEPWLENASILGFNVASDPTRAIAVSRARDSGAFAMTQPVQLLNDTQRSPGVIVYFPVYDTIKRLHTAVERREHILGYATAIVRIGDLINAAVIPFSSDDFHLDIVDVTEPDTPHVFYRVGESHVPSYAQELIYQKEIAIGGRVLLLAINPTEKFLNEHVSLQSWFVLAGGLLFCSLLGGFLLLISGRTQHITNLVEQRTKELAAILENAVESILVVDEHGVIQKANQAAAKLLHYPLEQFPGLHIVDLIPGLSDAFVSNSTQTVAPELRESVGRCSSGKEVAIEMSVSPVEIHDRKFFTFIIHDATERRKVERLKSEFISTVSHELRTPLTSIKGALSIVTSGSMGELPKNINDLLGIASSNAERLSRLVNDILDIEKLEFGKVQLTLKPHRVYPLLQQSIEQNFGYGARYGVTLQLDAPSETAMAAVANLDSDRFLQIMANLISNAVKFSFLDGVVRVVLVSEGDNIKISVIDEGQGMADDFRQHIFKKFAQADSSNTRRRDGTGLGLSITKVIIERMGGKIDYRSTLGKGTTFFFTLPLYTGD
ncbi:CHASE domain-containing protein [Cellvibrio sp. pealriver]|uniref:CHASE domain-containing protein n=1 Tax=Cellvibrio sp. pealriver TaxID=1622269 RepID=UPI00066FBE71|nr:CHASE domain-containing protein [Cellvibrio sp. pealriver]